MYLKGKKKNNFRLSITIDSLFINGFSIIKLLYMVIGLILNVNIKYLD